MSAPSASSEFAVRTHAQDETSFTHPSAPLSYRILQAAESTLYWSGAAALYARTIAPPTAAILTYHSVLAQGEERWIDPHNAISQEHFERQVEFLASHRRVLSMSKLIDDLENKQPIQRGTVTITFDDGYLDVLTVAAPILAKYGLPAIVYLSTAWSDDGRPAWIDRLFTAFRHRTRDEITIKEASLTKASLYNGHAPAVYGTLNQSLIPMPTNERERVLDDIVRQLAPKQQTPRLIMTWDRVKELVERYPNIELGVHTVDHVDLTACSDDQARAQILGSIDAVERHIGFRPVHFSYPFDRATERTREIARSCGLRSAVGSGGDGMTSATSDLFALPRLTTTDSLNRVRFITSGAYPGLNRALFRRG